MPEPPEVEDSLLRALFGRARPVIGVIHAPPLPGAPASEGPFGETRDRVRRDAMALLEGGADGVLLENFGDAPFHGSRVPPETTAHLAVLAADVRRAAPGLALGVNVLRNDSLAALAVASASEATFVRVNVLAGARVTDQGIVEGEADRLLRRRRSLAPGVRIFADVDVKHSAALSPRPLVEEAGELATRAGADALIVTGSGTGRPVDQGELEQVVRGTPDTPVLAGSGVTPRTVGRTLGRCDGVIVGSALRADGRAGGPVEEERVRRLVDAAHRARNKPGGEAR